MNARVEVAWPQPLMPVRLLRRVNRFAVEAVLNDHTVYLHLPNSGRMAELLMPGTEGRAYLLGGAGRRTRGELLLVRYGERWVSVDARMPNRLLEACLKARALPAFAEATGWRREVRWGSGRVDFALERAGAVGPWLVETKSCNLVEDGVALFPDAPTVRGSRHLQELAQAVSGGGRAAVVWFVQRDDAQLLMPHRRADPAFAAALEAAVEVGVEVYAYRCRVNEEGIAVLDAIPVQVERPGGCPYQDSLP